jgi:glycosyltransferase involved in cell wall biosynthesis
VLLSEDGVVRGLRLVYIIGTYPSLTTTFIDREIQTLRQWGVELEVVAARRPADGTPLSVEQRALKEGTIYLLPAAWLCLLVSQLHFAILHPRRYLGTLAYLLTRTHPRGKARYLTPRFMTLLHFLEGVYAAYLLRKHEFEELHAHFVDRAATIALVTGRMLNKPYSLSIHAGPDVFVDPVLLREKVLGARHVATCTRYNRTYVEKIVGQELGHKISYIRHGLDLAKYRPRQSAADEHCLVLSVGQLTERKGFADLIRGCRVLRDLGHRFRCEIIGEGPQRQELEDLVERLSLRDTVSLCGALPHEQVIEKYRQAMVFALPCKVSLDGNMDGIPNVLPEAMAMQVPVVSTHLPAIAELVEHEANGLLVPAGDAAALAAAIARLLESPALRRRLGRNGRRSVDAYFNVRHNIRQFAATLWPDWFECTDAESP